MHFRPSKVRTDRGIGRKLDLSALSAVVGA